MFTAIQQQILSDADKALIKAGLYLETKIKEEAGREAYDTGTFAGSINTRLTRP
jgi:hypothetical protein